MDEDEILRRQHEGIKLRREIGDFEYKKVKARRRRERYLQMQEEAKKLMGDAYYPVDTIPQVKKKPKMPMVGVIVVDDSGEHVYMWNAPNLKGTVIPSKQNIAGYKEAVFEAFQKAFGRLLENR